MILPEGFYEYYYVVYQGPGILGTVVLPQMRHELGIDNPDGFNVTAATKLLRGRFPAPVMITNWVRVTKKRQEEFEEYAQAAPENAGQVPAKDNITHLHLVKRDDDGPPKGAE